MNLHLHCVKCVDPKIDLNWTGVIIYNGKSLCWSHYNEEKELEK